MIIISRDDDDINDVATMGGVNLTEESRNILASNSEFIGTHIRSCSDEAFLHHSALQKRVSCIGIVIIAMCLCCRRQFVFNMLFINYVK